MPIFWRLGLPRLLGALSLEPEKIEIFCFWRFILDPWCRYSTWSRGHPSGHIRSTKWSKKVVTIDFFKKGYVTYEIVGNCMGNRMSLFSGSSEVTEGHSGHFSPKGSNFNVFRKGHVSYHIIGNCMGNRMTLF